MGEGQVAIIGAGVAGLSAARYLTSQGFEVSIFESHDELGGQWDWRNPRSGIWPQMRTNTASCVTRLSDVHYPADVALFPGNGEVLDLLRGFADRYGLRSRVRFGAEVTRLAIGANGGYKVSWSGSGRSKTAHFDRAVVATGRFNRPSIPPIDGLAGFLGVGGVSHTFGYKDPERYRGLRIVIGGGSISALEIASDLAMLGTARVHLAQRRQRYVVPKMVIDSPVEYHTMTRAIALAAETTPPAEMRATIRDLILRIAGDPVRYGAPPAHPDLEQAGTTLSQHYLNLVAEDRIDVRPWIAAVDGTTVTFTDGSSVEADALIFGTGFDLNLPFLDDSIKETVQYSTRGLALSDFTFHPDLDGLAFLGLWAQRGSFPVPLEQQARYLAYTWGGAVPSPTPDRLRQGVRECIETDHHRGYRQQNEMAIRFARLAGVDPAGVGDSGLQRLLTLSAVTGEMFRIVGTDARPDAEDILRRDFDRYAPREARAALAGSPGLAVV